MSKLVIHFVDSSSITLQQDAKLNGQSFSNPEDLCRALLELGEKRNWARLESNGKCWFINPRTIIYIKPSIDGPELNTFSY